MKKRRYKKGFRESRGLAYFLEDFGNKESDIQLLEDTWVTENFKNSKELFSFLDQAKAKCRLSDLNLDFGVHKALVDDRFLESFAERYSKVTTLNLEGCHKLTSGGLRRAGSLFFHIEHLNVKYCKGLGPGLSFLSAFPHLLSLDLSGLDLEDGDLHELSFCPRLERINLSNLSNVSDAGLVLLPEYCPRVRSIALRHNLRLSDRALDLIEECDLEQLDVSGTKISNKSLRRISVAWPNMRDLRFRATQITDLGLEALCLPRLRLLDLADSDSITEEGVEGLLFHHPSLKVCAV